MQLRQAYPKIEAKNAQVVAIGMGDPSETRTFKERLKVPFAMLSDDGKSSYNTVALGRVNGVAELRGNFLGAMLREAATGNFGGIPVGDINQLGGTMIVDTSGTVRYVHRATSTSDNAPLSDVLKVLDMINA